MSSTYSYSRNPYTQISSWPGYTILPSDGDPLYAQSANFYEEAIQDRNMYVWEGALKMPVFNGGYRMLSVDNVSIMVYPFTCQVIDAMGNYVLVKYDTPSVLTSANQLVPGPFSINTWYYVYLNIFPDNSTKLVIDSNPPHFYLLYADIAGSQNVNSKFIGSFRVDGLGNIRRFFKDGQKVMYFDAAPALLAGTATVDTPISLMDYIPPYSGFATLLLNSFNGDFVDNYLQIRSNVFPGFKIKLAGEAPGFRQFIQSDMIEYNVDNTLAINYHFNVSGVEVSKVDIYVVGYRE